MEVGVKLDEDLSPIVGEPLRAAGYSVASVNEQGWSGIADEELWRRVRKESRMLMTADRGFGDLRVYPPGEHSGLVLLRPEHESILNYRQLVEHLLSRYALKELVGTLTIVTPDRIRIRRS